MNMGVCQLELAENNARVGGQQTESGDDNDSPNIRFFSLTSPHSKLGTRTYGASPMVATAEGSDRIPSDIVSAIMTVDP